MSQVCGLNCPLKVPLSVFPSSREERVNEDCSKYITSGETKLGDMFMCADKAQNTREYIISLFCCSLCHEPSFTKNLNFNPTVKLKLSTLATSHSEQTRKISVNLYFTCSFLKG